DWVPSGWVPIEVEKDKIKVWGRDYYIDKGGLINQIESQSHVLFSAPVKIKYIINGIENEISISEPKYILKDKGRVEFEQKGETSHFKLSTNQKIEFDGFDIVELKILPKNKFKIDKLYMQVNLTDEMKYLNFYGPFGKIEEMDIREGTTGLQISNDRVGLQWFTESYKGWMINSQKPRITIKKADKGWEVSFLFVNEPTEIESPMEIRFAFQSMPVKPYFKNWRDIRPQGWGFVGPPVNLVMTGEGQIWTTTSTCPYPRNWQVLDEMVKYVRQFNQKVYPYLNPFSIGLYQSVKKEAPFMLHHQWKKEYDIEQQNAPKIEEYFYYAADWNIKPPFIQESGRWKDERACCSPSSSFVDYFEYGVYDILTKTDLDGFYFDLAAPKINYDEEKGFSYYTKDGVLEGTDEIFAARNHFKRIYYLFDKYRGPDRKPYTLGHSSPESPYASFFDCCFCGEMIKPKKPYDWTHTYLQERIECRPIAPPPTGEINYELYPYRALFSPFYNMPIFYLPQYGYVKELGRMPELSRETLSITFLHNTILWPAYIYSSTVYDFWRKVEIPFGMGDTIFYPYWENGTKTNYEFIKASYWKKENRDDYLVAVANWSDENVVASIKLSEQLSKFESCMDMESGEKIKIENGLEIEIQKHNLRVFRFCASE
ncbi:MAG: DUF6067 family protein, partial [Candidatus Ratteibacteria bacterium]|nr:DUF6067 family protein [Candidatus Ratteibacteria bacterium]